MTTPWTELEQAAVCYLTTKGRITGRPHTIEIWFALESGTVYLLSGGGLGSDWVRNIVADGAVTIAARGEQRSGSGRIIADPDEQARARWAVFDKYSRSNRGLERWRDTALPVAVDLDPTRRE